MWEIRGKQIVEMRPLQKVKPCPPVRSRGAGLGKRQRGALWRGRRPPRELLLPATPLPGRPRPNSPLRVRR